MAVVQIISPLPGVFYRRPDPDSPPYVADGAEVAAGTVIGVIELMKQFSEITAEQAGAQIAFLIEDGEEVDIDQVIATFLAS